MFFAVLVFITCTGLLNMKHWLFLLYFVSSFSADFENWHLTDGKSRSIKKCFITTCEIAEKNFVHIIIIWFGYYFLLVSILLRCLSCLDSDAGHSHGHYHFCHILSSSTFSSPCQKYTIKCTHASFLLFII